MKKQAQLGLIVEGKAASSALLRLPTIAQELGPVKSASMRVAHRLSNMLHAGYPVDDYEELQAARLILLRVPDASVSRLVDELCSSGLLFRKLAFALCETWLRTDVLEPLRQRGSAVATLVSIPTVRHNWFAVEGQTSAVRQIRRLLDRNDMYSTEILSESKALLFGAQLLATVLPLPLLAAAQEALRCSGISGKPLSALMEEMGLKMVRDFAKGTRLLWGGPLTQCSIETANSYFEDLRRNHPRLATTLDQQIERLASSAQMEDQPGRCRPNGVLSSQAGSKPA